MLDIREYRESDCEALRRIHARSGADYKFPDLSSPLFAVKLVAERDGEPASLLAGKIDVETYLLASGSPAAKWEDIRALQPAYLRALWEKGVDDTFCVVPPEIDAKFAKRMASLGWVPARNWRAWTRETGIIER